MEELLAKSERYIKNISPINRRYLYNKIPWEVRLIGIKGARGTGKSTLLLQRLQELALPPRNASYWSLDDLYFTSNSLAKAGEQFYLQGGKFLFLDEVHKYPGWSRHIKNLYDQFPDLKIIFTGSSIIDISREEADLSRRALMFSLAGMSFREFMLLHYQKKLPILGIKEIVEPDVRWRDLFPADFRPLQYFQEYLEMGYYPFSLEDRTNFLSRLQQVIRIIVEYDMAALPDFDIRNAQKLLQLLYLISANVPFKPNLSDLAKRTGIHRNTIGNYFQFLEEARLIRLLYPEGISLSTLQKPEKIFLNNTNLAYALASDLTNKGNLRETFFASQVAVNHHLTLPKEGDFVVDNQWIFEVGGENKGRKQIKHLENSFVVIDDKDFPVTKIPLWIFGMLY